MPEAAKSKIADGVAPNNEVIDFIFYHNRETYSESISYITKKGVENRNAPGDNLSNDIFDGKSNGVELPDDKTYIARNMGFSDLYWAMKFWVDGDIYKNLKKLEIKEISSFEPPDFKDESKKDEIIKIYKELKRDLNQTSMLMATFLVNGKNKPVGYFAANDDLAFVCTGDYPINTIEKKKDIMAHYKREQRLLHEMVVPHHGSNDYCEYIPFDFLKRAYAQNYPPYKNYQHPGAKTIKNLEDWGIEFINIRENIQEN
jgi:hypothetical protein